MSTSGSGARPGTPEQEPVQDSIGQLLADWARERPDLDFSPVGVINRLARVRAHIDSALLQVFRGFGLTAADFRVIVTLRRVGSPYELPQARLMTQLALTSGTISLRVDRLAKRGIVTREADPDDKRGQRVRLTAEGLRLFDKVPPLHPATWAGAGSSARSWSAARMRSRMTGSRALYCLRARPLSSTS